MFFLAGCDQMRDQPRLDAFEQSSFFEDGMASRPPVEGTVAQGHLRDDDHLYTGKVNGVFVRSYPFQVNEATLRRGQERYNIYCAVCHNTTGTGDGIIVRRGFKPPPSFHEERLRRLPEGYFFDIITNGFGFMSGYAAELAAEDRWAVIAYIRTLQRSQHTSLADLTPEEIEELRKSGTEDDTHES